MIFKRTFYRLINPIRRLYWFIFQPATFGVKVLIEHNGKYLMIRNSYGKGYWTFPGGGKRKQETPEDAAKRETLEEVGISLEAITYLGDYTSRREHKRDTVHCFYALVENDNFVTDGDEIAEARWFPTDQLPEFLSPAVGKVINLKQQ